MIGFNALNGVNLRIRLMVNEHCTEQGTVMAGRFRLLHTPPPVEAK